MVVVEGFDFREILQGFLFIAHAIVTNIVLDSFWDNFTEDQLRAFARMLYHSSYENITQTHVSLSGVVPGIAIIRAILSDGNLATRKLHL